MYALPLCMICRARSVSPDAELNPTILNPKPYIPKPQTLEWAAVFSRLPVPFLK
jgi:hypothetical protein